MTQPRPKRREFVPAYLALLVGDELAHRVQEAYRHLENCDQYRPCWHAGQYPEINRPLTNEEYRKAQDAAARLGLTRLDHKHGRT